MKKLLRISLIAAVVSVVAYLGVALVMIFLPTPTFAGAPFPVAERIPAEFTPQQYTMRDGEILFARQFPAESDMTILLLHGVASDSAAFNTSAQMLRAAIGAEVAAIGAEVVVLDLRGHGQSGGTVGDVDYIGQYQDDVTDVVAEIQAEKPNGRLILAGHSMGGGIGLQYAQIEDAPAVDGYLFFAPHLGTNAPTMPQPDPEAADATADFSQLHVPRLIGLIMLNQVGIKTLGHLDTLFFNLTDEVTHTYSFRATANSAPQDYVAALTAVNAPMLVGGNDEAFHADEYPAAVAAYSDGEVHLVQGESHTSIVESPTAMRIIENWLNETALATN